MENSRTRQPSTNGKLNLSVAALLLILCATGCRDSVQKQDHNEEQEQVKHSEVEPAGRSPMVAANPHSSVIPQQDSKKETIPTDQEDPLKPGVEKGKVKLPTTNGHETKTEVPQVLWARVTGWLVWTKYSLGLQRGLVSSEPFAGHSCWLLTSEW